MEGELFYYIIIIVVLLVIIELIIRKIILFVNKKFQWLIIQKDETPKLDLEGLKKFFEHGYDSELGWIRKPMTSHKENGKYGETKWSINQKSARCNPTWDSKPSQISCYGDSFTFSRQVNDNETWEHFLSNKIQTNVINFGVGNYGIDQAFLRLKREFPKNKTEIVIMGVVPDTISRIVSVWKHYYEYGNTFGFKPRFLLKNENNKLINNFIDDEMKFQNYEQFLPEIKKHDYFYKEKFMQEKISFPYSITILKNIKRNFSVIYWVLRGRSKKSISEELKWKPMSIIMKINLKWRIKLYRNKKVKKIFENIILDFIDFSKENRFKPILVFLPQKDDIIFIKKNYHFYKNFIEKISKFENIIIFDMSELLINEDNLDKIYSDNNEYGGHYSREGNEKIAKKIENILRERKLL